jgi:hypothetical protein
MAISFKDIALHVYKHLLHVKIAAIKVQILYYIAVFLFKKPHFFGENIFKIITLAQIFGQKRT